MDTLQGSGNNGHSEYMAKVRGQYSHVWVCRGAFDPQVHGHVAFIAVVQPVGPQAQVHLWGPFNLRTHTRH